MPILAKIQPADVDAVKAVFISAIRFATSSDGSCPVFPDELKNSAQEQVEYMLVEDEDMPAVTSDEEVKCEVRIGLSNVLSLFVNELNSLLSEFTITAEKRVFDCLVDLEWLCNIVPKMDMMKDFVSSWVDVSSYISGIVQDTKLISVMWDLKLKLIRVSVKVLEAVGYGNVILPAPDRVQLLKIWLPYIRKMKPLLDYEGDEGADYFPYKMDDDLCQSIEGAMMSLVLALPSNDQADIFADWMHAEQIYAWVGCHSAKLGNLYAAAPTRPNNTVSITSILGGNSENTGTSIARHIVLKTGINIILACNIPKNNLMLEADVERILVQKLRSLGYTASEPQHLR